MVIKWEKGKGKSKKETLLSEEKKEMEEIKKESKSITVSPATIS